MKMKTAILDSNQIDYSKTHRAPQPNTIFIKHTQTHQSRQKPEQSAPIIVGEIVAQLIHIVDTRLAGLAILLEVGQHENDVLHALIDRGDVRRLRAFGREIVAGRKLTSVCMCFIRDR
jgi:hypothetical protein